MKAIILERPGQFAVTEIAAASRPGPGEALVRVHRVGICGSDYGGYLGKMPFYSYPRIPGHELGVEVLQVGDGVTNVQPGERCSIEPYLNCQNCPACRRGGSNCCENLQVLGVHTDGGLRPEFIVPARKLHPAATLTFEQLALVETLAIGCHAVNRGRAQAGENVLVIGAGPIGLSVVQFAKLAGSRVLVLDLSEPRLEFCQRRLHADEVVVSRGLDADVAALAQLTNGELPTLVIDATGSHQSMSGAFNFVGFTGRLVYVGITSKPVTFEHPLMHRREMTLLASRNALPPDFPRIIRLIEDGRIDTRPWVTHQAGFADLITEFPKWLLPETGVVKAIVTVT